MSFPWLDRTPPRRNGAKLRAEVAAAEIADRAATLFRLGFTKHQATERLTAAHRVGVRSALEGRPPQAPRRPVGPGDRQDRRRYVCAPSRRLVKHALAPRRRRRRASRRARRPPRALPRRRASTPCSTSSGTWRWLLRTDEAGTSRVEHETWHLRPDPGAPTHLVGRYMRTVEVRSLDRVPFQCNQRPVVPPARALRRHRRRRCEGRVPRPRDRLHDRAVALRSRLSPRRRLHGPAPRRRG